MQGCDECVSLLLRAGADVTSVNDSGNHFLVPVCNCFAILTNLIKLLFCAILTILVHLEGKSALGLAADHARMEDFLEIAGSLVIAGCRGTDKDWAILGFDFQLKV